MCDISVNLPTVAAFLMLYSLRFGCKVIWAWTLLRSLFYLIFLVLIFIWMYAPESDMKLAQPTENHYVYVFVPYIVLITTESFVFIASIILGAGVFCYSPMRIKEYLVTRFCALVFETLGFATLCFHHDYYIGWYLVFLMIIILEFYSFIVVYSYYVELTREQEEKDWEEAAMGGDLVVNYACLPERRQPSGSGASQDTREIEPSQTTRDTTDTRTTRIMSTSRNTRKPSDTRNERSKRHMREMRRIMRFK